MIFNSYRDAQLVKEVIKSKHVEVGAYTYYSGYYHDKDFNDCVMYVDERDNWRDEGSIDKLIIGKFCSIATGVKFMLGGTQGHNHAWIAAYPLDFLDDDFDGYQKVAPKAQKQRGHTTIGNDVWIGAQALIMPGVTIGDGAVIGAYSLVTKSVGPYEIWGGNPAKKIKKRFSDEEIKQLLKIKWWEWSEEKIKAHLPLLRSSDVQALAEAVQI